VTENDDTAARCRRHRESVEDALEASRRELDPGVVTLVWFEVVDRRRVGRQDLPLRLQGERRVVELLLHPLGDRERPERVDQRLR
jgi:hypothetical protein